MLPDDSGAAPERVVLTPTVFNRLVRDLIEDTFVSVWIEGELSNVARPASGHLYFTIKDAGAQIRCAMFKPKSTWIKFRPADGQHVLLRGRASLYEARGEFQLIVEHLEEAGEGALRREFERLKAKLAAEGLFEAARKRALPKRPRRIGVLTSPSGAAVRDVLSVLRRRFPLIEVDIIAVPVQGRDAPAAIVAALRRVGLALRHDVLLLTRGGGSLEDLWAFNDETLARAIAASPIPVVSAIGHEIDFTIADFVADLRAPTPSAAAELLVPDVVELVRALSRIRTSIARCMRHKLDTAAQRTDQLAARIAVQHPHARLLRGRDRLMALRGHLRSCAIAALERHRHRSERAFARLSARNPRGRIERADERTNALRDRAQRAIAQRIRQQTLHLKQLARALNAVNPLATLDRGYAILFERESGRVVRSVAQVVPGAALVGRLADGELDLHVDAD